MNQRRVADWLLAGAVALSAVLVSVNYFTQPADLRSMTYRLATASDAPATHAESEMEAYENALQEALLSAYVDLNAASYEELVALPGIGDVLASRIIAQREIAPFVSVEDLDRVKGIGPKTVEKLAPYVYVEHPPL